MVSMNESGSEFDSGNKSKLEDSNKPKETKGLPRRSGEDRFKNTSKQPHNARRSGSKTPRGSHRPGRHEREQKKAFLNERQQDIDSSIQEELLNKSFKARGRKGEISINHLLNFQLPELEKSGYKGQRPKRQTKRKNEGYIHIDLSIEEFINVNYRFLIDEKFDYGAQENDPNIPIPEDKIVRVIAPKGQSCPICLCEEPIAPRMVSCGHIFCFSCLIHFFAVEQTTKNPETGIVKKKKYKDCPLCGNIIKQERIKPVIFNDEIMGNLDTFPGVPSLGKEHQLFLMCRPHGSALSLPVGLNVDPLKVGNFPNYSHKELAVYCHAMKCDSSVALDLLQKDLIAINSQYEIDKALYNEDKKYVDLAIDSINNQIISTISEETIVSDIREADETIDIATVSKELENLQTSEREQLTDLKTKYNDKNAYFYYQTAFNSPIKFFLSPLDVKILLRSFESYANFPDTLQIVVENLHYGTVVTEQLIHRYKYISHLPLGTEIAFIDVDWRNTNILSKEIQDEFSAELKQRRRQFFKRKNKEDNDKRAYQQKLEEEQMKFYQEESRNIILDESLRKSVLKDAPSLLESGVRNRMKQEVGTPRGLTPTAEAATVQETTIWGTSIPVTPDPEKLSEEKEFQEMLLRKMYGEGNDRDGKEEGFRESKKGSKRKKKGKVLLFSNTNPQNPQK